MLNALRPHPELAVFLTLAAGFVIGRIRLGSFKLGNVVGTLIAGVLIGQLDIKVDPTVKRCSSRSSCLPPAIRSDPVLSRLEEECASPGRADGRALRDQSGDDARGGASAWLRQRDGGRPDGRGVHRIDRHRHGQRHDRPARSARGREDETEEQHPCGLCGQLPGGHGIRRVVSVGRGSPSASSRPEGGEPETGERRCRRRRHLGSRRSMAYKEWSVRAYRLADGAVGRTVADLERSASPERVFVERIRRGAELIDATPETVLQSGDVVAIAARRRVLLSGSLPLGEEVEDPALLDFPMATLDVVVTKRDVAEQPLSVLAQRHGRGVVLVKLIRGGEEIPFDAETIINRGDLLRLAGAQRDVERVGQAVGYIERPSSESDVVFLGLGIVVGGLVGLLTLTVGGLPLTLTTSGGALIMGLVFGWLRSVYPTFGRIPEPALWIFDTVGLAVFIGIVGLTAARRSFPGFARQGRACWSSG